MGSHETRNMLCAKAIVKWMKDHPTDQESIFLAVRLTEDWCLECTNNSKNKTSRRQTTMLKVEQ